MTHGGTRRERRSTTNHRTRTRRRLAATASAAVVTWIAAAGLAAAATGTAVAGETAGGAVAAAGAPAKQALRVVGLTDDGRLVWFRADGPGAARSLGKVRGLVGDGSLVGIDFRVQDQSLYGVGDAGGIYTVDTRHGRAVATKVSQLTVPLQGMSFGVDFNPAANRLRVVSDTGQNLRHNIDDPAGAPAAGTTATDGTLSYTPPTAATGVTAVGYTNNDLDPTTATTLFDIDTMLDQVAVQAPANAGPLSPTGKLGVDAGSAAGLDVYSWLSEQGGTVRNKAFASLDVAGRTRLYSVDLLTGRATASGAFPATRRVVDIAVPLDQG